MIEIMPLLAGYLGGVVYGLLMGIAARQGGLPAPWTFILPAALFWPLLLPLMILIPGRKPWKFRA